MNQAAVAVQELIDRQVAQGRQIGLQVAAYRHGQPFFEVHAGLLGPHDDRPVQPDSIFCSFSATKGVAALAVHLLADQGLIDYDAPVASYWPGFARHGKERITVAQALSHQAGLHAMPEPFDPRHIIDWEAGLARMEDGVPAWEPGTATGYHAVTFAWLVGGIVAGATGRHIQEVIRTELAAPLGVASEFYVGVPVADATVRARLATLDLVAAGEGLPIPDDAPFYQAMPKAMWPYFNDLALREACLPSGNGHFSARALAKMYGALANGGEIGGVRLCGPDRIDAMCRLQTERADRVLMAPVRKALGFFLGGFGPTPDGRMVAGLQGPRETAFGHAGAGGSLGYADPELGLGLAVTVNKMAFPMPGEGTTQEICDLARELAVA